MEIHGHQVSSGPQTRVDRIRLADSVWVRGEQVISAGAPAAVDAGLAIFSRGGNAFDAAVAASLVEGVALPMKCGLGGDLVALIYKDDRLRSLISVGPGVAELATQYQTLQQVGPTSVGVPGAPHGYATLARLGKLGLQALAAPAINAASNGIRWSRIAVELTAESKDLLEAHNASIPFLPRGQVPREGDLLRLPRLAELLEEFSIRGNELFWGPAGRVVANHVRELGGVLAKSDLRSDVARWQAPRHVTLEGGHVLSVTPRPTYGPLLTRILEQVTTATISPVIAVVEAISRRNELAGDHRGGGTSVVITADRDRNVAVVVHSNSFPHYGSGLVVPEYDLILNNRAGRGFELETKKGGHNAPIPGRRPATTLHAWALKTQGHGRYLGATPGGSNQVAWNTQVILDILRGETNLGALVTVPRWALAEIGDVLVVEEGHSLASRTDVERVPALSLRSVQQVLALRDGGTQVEIAADPRTGARADAL